ncbi:MAG: hypothetical protein DWI22_15495 [Planctomycetota bacterium]|nr:MAG: hypothetical protein DWI22_15495 [Planctomycetota bacterium]
MHSAVEFACPKGPSRRSVMATLASGMRQLAGTMRFTFPATVAALADSPQRERSVNNQLRHNITWLRRRCDTNCMVVPNIGGQGRGSL